MTRRERLLARILSGAADQNIRFDELCRLLRDLGFDERTRGSHHIFTQSGIEEILNLQPREWSRQALPGPTGPHRARQAQADWRPLSDGNRDTQVRSHHLLERRRRRLHRRDAGTARLRRPLPDYSRSDREAVRLLLRGGEASLAFSAFVYEQDRAGHRLMLDELLVMNHLQHERRADSHTVGQLTQRGEAHARGVLERLVERGLVEPCRDGRERVYHLSASVYKQLGMPAGYVRMRGFDVIRQESMVLEYVAAHGRITRREVRDLCGCDDLQAKNLLRRMVKDNKLQLVDARSKAYYILP